jgi:hypothetical protein
MSASKAPFKSLPATSGLPPSTHIIGPVRLIRLCRSQIARSANAAPRGKAPSLPPPTPTGNDPTGKSPEQFIDPTVQPLVKKYSDFPKTQISPYIRRPVPPRGVSRSSWTRGGMRWPQGALKTRALNCGRQNRMVLTPRRWRQVCGKRFPRATVTKKPDRRGEYDISRKTIARGMPGDAGVT